MEECQCSGPGYCDFFKQQMTYDPPNWQWCQGASAAERSEYKMACDKKHKRHSFGNIECAFLTNAQLAEDCVKHLLPKIAHLNVSGIVAIPRSGFLVASICATFLNLPLYTISNKKITICNSLSDFGGYRMNNFSSSSGRLLFIDDTVFSGTTLGRIKELFGDDHLYAALYCKPDHLDVVDVYGKELDAPHLLEWHFFNSTHVEKTLFDLDGVFIPNVPVSCCLDDDRYEDYICHTKPFYHRLPKAYKLKAIVTGRLDKFRKQTEDWLAKYNFEYGDLIMFPTEKRKQRDANHVKEVGKYKADAYKKSSAVFFMESEKAEGKAIKKYCHKRVILPNDGVVL